MHMNSGQWNCSAEQFKGRAFKTSQFSSSCPFIQSLSPSHLKVLGIQKPPEEKLEQRNSSFVQFVVVFEQFFSSSPFWQSKSPSQIHLFGTQTPEHSKLSGRQMLLSFHPGGEGVDVDSVDELRFFGLQSVSSDSSSQSTISSHFQDLSMHRPVLLHTK